VTALTLHGDAGHAVGNAVLGGLLLALLARAVGPGVAIRAGAALGRCRDSRGRLAGAAGLRLHRRVHAVFGALGALAAFPSIGGAPGSRSAQASRCWHFSAPRNAPTSPGHLCGFVRASCWAPLPPGFRRCRSRAAQIALSLTAALVPVLAWVAAFH